jgi:hypothetical protein
VQRRARFSYDSIWSRWSCRRAELPPKLLDRFWACFCSVPVKRWSNGHNGMHEDVKLGNYKQNRTVDARLFRVKINSDCKYLEVLPRAIHGSHWRGPAKCDIHRRDLRFNPGGSMELVYVNDSGQLGSVQPPMLPNELQKQHAIVTEQQGVIQTQQQQIDSLRKQNANFQQQLQDQRANF